MLSGSFGVSAAKLSIPEGDLIKEENAGLWFVIQFEQQTMSIVHHADKVALLLMSLPLVERGRQLCRQPHRVLR